MQAKSWPILLLLFSAPLQAASPDICNTGHQQSPIDIRQAVPAEKKSLEFTTIPNTLNSYSDGNTFHVYFNPGNTLTVDGGHYDLSEMDFHHPSEHTKDGKAYPMEAHLVFQNAKGEKAVVGIWMIEGMKNKFLQPIWKNMPSNKGDKVRHPGVSLDLKDFLPSDKSAYSYVGSLTTPPCSENVRWFVLQSPVQISGNQLKKFEKTFTENARSAMALNGRQISSFQ